MRGLALVLTLACSSSSSTVQRLTPFQAPRWAAFPSDDEIVRAIVGNTGSEAQRADAEAFTRDLLLPRVRTRTASDLARLRFELDSLKITFEMFEREALGDELLRLAVFEAVGSLGSEAAGLAAARLKTALWPADPFPETWERSSAINPSMVAGAATMLHYRMLEIEGRYASRLPIVFSCGEVEMFDRQAGEHRTVVLARNQIYVALTGDYTETSGAIFSELWNRGIRTRRVADDQPY